MSKGVMAMEFGDAVDRLTDDDSWMDVAMVFVGSVAPIAVANLVEGAGGLGPPNERHGVGVAGGAAIGGYSIPSGEASTPSTRSHSEPGRTRVCRSSPPEITDHGEGHPHRQRGQNRARRRLPERPVESGRHAFQTDPWGRRNCAPAKYTQQRAFQTSDRNRHRICSLCVQKPRPWILEKMFEQGDVVSVPQPVPDRSGVRGPQ